MSSNPVFPADVKGRLYIPREEHYCRAKYTPDGRLLSTEWASRPIFTHDSDVEGILFEDASAKKSGGSTVAELIGDYCDPEDNARRAINRAKVRAFDLIMCNPDLLAFSTLTCASDKVDRTDYNAVYKYLKVWLSNLVSRAGLRYILCPEYHKDGESIHFHMISNVESLRAVPALTPSGNIRTRGGKPVFNIPLWKLGFSTMQIIDRSDPREAVAKYIFKYMGKASGAKIGGRYFLHGGKMAEPYYLYADELCHFGEDVPKWSQEVRPCANLTYTKHYFV